MNKDETIKNIQDIINANSGTISEQSAKSIAKALYNAGYRKVPDGAVILTPEERDEELKACNELSETNKCFASNMKSVLEIEKRNAVEEFAKKCKERINADYVNGCLNNHKGHLTEYDIDELIKEFLK